RFSVPVLNVTQMVKGAAADRFASALDSPYVYAQRAGLPAIESLEDYLRVIDAIFAKAVESDAVCLKSTLAYERTLRFEKVSRERAERVFGRPRSEITDAEQQDFEDF